MKIMFTSGAHIHSIGKGIEINIKFLQALNYYKRYFHAKFIVGTHMFLFYKIIIYLDIEIRKI